MADRALYNANDGLSGRDGGPYLDQEEQRLAEIRRAKIEGREPDFENPGATSGTVLVTADQLLANQGVNNLPSTDGTTKSSAEAAVKALADDDSNNLRAQAVLPEDAVAAPEEESDLSMRASLMTDGSVPVGEKNDEPYEPPTDEQHQDTPVLPASDSGEAVATNEQPAQTNTEESTVSSQPPATPA